MSASNYLLIASALLTKIHIRDGIGIWACWKLLRKLSGMKRKPMKYFLFWKELKVQNIKKKKHMKSICKLFVKSEEKKKQRSFCMKIFPILLSEKKRFKKIWLKRILKKLVLLLMKVFSGMKRIDQGWLMNGATGF